MVAVTVPIAMPISRAPREDMIVRASTVDAAVIEATSGVALDCCKTSIVPEARDTIAGDSAVQAASGVTARTESGALIPQSRERGHRTHTHRREPLRRPHHASAAVTETGPGRE